MYDFTAILLLILGIASLGFGIYLFYLFLPFWYGLFGAMLGVGLSQLFFDQTTWFNQIISWTMIIGLALGLAFAAYSLEPYRRYLVGGLLGFSIGLLVAGMFTLGSFWAVLFAILGAILFAMLTAVVFDPLIIVGSSITGATLIIDSIFLLTHWSAVNRIENTPATVLIWSLLIIVGIGWQASSILNGPKSSSINVAGA